MSVIVNAIKSLPDLISLNPATKIEITNAEILLCLNFSAEYKDYLSEFGAIIADGIELTGISKSEHRNVINLTKQEWELNKKVPHNLYVIENIGIDGIIIWQDQSGTVYQTAPNREPVKLAESLEKYIETHV